MRLENSEGSTDWTLRAGDTPLPVPPASQPLLRLLGGAGKQHVLNGATVFPAGAAQSLNHRPATLTVDGVHFLRLIQTVTALPLYHPPGGRAMTQRMGTDHDLKYQPLSQEVWLLAGHPISWPELLCCPFTQVHTPRPSHRQPLIA